MKIPAVLLNHKTYSATVATLSPPAYYTQPFSNNHVTTGTSDKWLVCINVHNCYNKYF